MKHLSRKIKLRLTALVLLLSTTIARAAAEVPPVNNDTNFKLDVNTVLTACAFLLLIVIFVLGSTLRSAIFFYHEKRKKESAASSSGAKLLSLIIATLLIATIPAMAQDATANNLQTSGPSTIKDAEVLRWVLYSVLSLEIIVIFLFTKMIRFFTGITTFKATSKKPPLFQIDFAKIWTRINKFKPIEEETSLDTGHSYDGIRELNNVTPPWFIAGFVLSILFAIIYLYRYHVAESAPLQIEEYNIAVAEAKVKQAEYLKKQANNVDENTVVLLGKDGVESGKALFATNCVACHGDKGQGGVGPNLTDNYWLHKGGIKDVFKSIKYGWQEKGMKSWKDDFSPNQIAQLASFVESLKGSNPPGGKEPQGDLYSEEAATTTKADTTKTNPEATK
jgi:cytochrome c oxidase cbb3-type subunit III